MINRAPRFLLPALAALLGASPALAASMSVDRNAPPPRLVLAAPSATQAGASLGAPTALAAIRSQQAGLPVLAAAALAASTPTLGGLRPAHRVAPRLRPAHADRPDVFGSTALAVSTTAFDEQFARVFARRDLGAAHAVARRYAAADRLAAIHGINAFVNAQVSFTDDARQHGAADRWNAAAETLGSRRGDCEDYAIAKMQMLRAAGVADEDLYLVVLKDLVRRADHAVLVVRHEDRFLVLDNGTDRVLDSDAVRDYKPVFSYSAGKAWVHGYQRAPAPAPRFHPVRVAAVAAN
ncbi:transglutaminase-like cysteine peptidase [Sphingomicrobium astaxanthinifaciens]|uniref:transglutaminase-like cysteine peptidase n=1 Tax=Sphingomicrobium astaxanthinifaciens TaxID=1227949 RepID=UPI001FCBE2D5|nr:transglutaminase-like cysteine peptidase [Sphingomicrobium astaxanthinifaciens]MCJ7420928.1 transglutaminase-like cysteine peptidase [Sphingomicrobium astaxanthinifaciens]